MLANTTYKVNLYVQPDPTATTVNNAAILTKMKASGMKTAVDAAVTTYGKATVSATTVTEAKVTWKTSPTVTTPLATTKITITGETSAAGYVYCMVAKDARRRLAAANATKNASTTKTPAASSTASTAKAGEAYKTMLTDKTLRSGGKYTWMSKETSATKATFSFVFDGKKEGTAYEWGCVATSLNPDMAAASYSSKAVGGSTTTTKTTTTPTKGSSALWSSLIAAVVMIVAVFFY